MAATPGSWRFIIPQSRILVAWIALNVSGFARPWDPYPFTLLNLALSFQAAYAVPSIMMSQNRQTTKDYLSGRRIFAPMSWPNARSPYSRRGSPP